MSASRPTKKKRQDAAPEIGSKRRKDKLTPGRKGGGRKLAPDSEEAISRVLNPAFLFDLRGFSLGTIAAAVSSCDDIAAMRVKKERGGRAITGMMIRPDQPATAATILDRLQATDEGQALLAKLVDRPPTAANDYLATITASKGEKLTLEQLEDALAEVEYRPSSTVPFSRAGNVVGFVLRFTGTTARNKHDQFRRSAGKLCLSFAHSGRHVAEEDVSGIACEHTRVEVRDVNYGDK